MTSLGGVARSLLLIVTALTTILFMQLYRSNLLLAIMRSMSATTPNTLSEFVDALEEGL